MRERHLGLDGVGDEVVSPLWDAARGNFGLDRSFESHRGLGKGRVCREAAHSQDESLAHREAMCPRSV